MQEKEVAEIRRRFRGDRSAITHVRGCYVNDSGEVAARFDQSLAMMSQEEGEKLLGVLRRTLSGTLDKNLVELSFATRQVAEGEEHRLLMALRDSGLKDEEAVERFFQTVMGTVELEGGYLILLAHDRYDVPFRGKDGGEMEDASEEVYSYLLCSICPVKPTKPALSFYARESRFYNRQTDWLVSPPELGFLFPAFNDRSADLYHALYYTRDSGENHPAFVDAVFRTPLPPPAQAQRERFQEVLGDSLGEECSYEVVQAVHDQLCQMVEEHKHNKEEEPPAVSKGAVSCVLRSCGISRTGVEEFERRYEDAFGEGTTLSPRNLVESGKLELAMPDVTIKVAGDRGAALVETRVIGGRRYILIPAEGTVEVNGVPIHIPEEATAGAPG